ncbi:hypothetical protein AGOR_G00064700 [Albula goreensis]|uniref:Ig-like domain-containing protein n=1 Tax=Albula goreensis TaxID=1534307 RepID=A0A8T3DRF8_9TELE|nr:hypothetical protein AGOR_G00064700 [Albula goreensis]
MDLVQRSLWGSMLLLYLNGLLLWDVCFGQRVVKIQSGPLYRAKGYPVAISCNVSGFSGPAEQTFEFSVYKPARPRVELRIISTADAGFGYASHSKRVMNKDIHIQRITGSSVLFKINNLLVDDAGEYECHTPNTDPSYLGSYSAKTTVNVIQDTLSVSSIPAILSKTEGESVQLECEVSSQTFQHTHLSVSWFLQSKDASEHHPIISLARDFTLSPGEGFEDRYRAGLIRLDKVQDTTYRLSMSQLQVSDQGQLYCMAEEWIQDPDHSWYKIAHNTSGMFTLQVQPLDILADVDSFKTRIEVPKENLQEGETLVIQCTVEANNILDSYFSVVWQKDEKVMAEIGPTGVPVIGPNYNSRASEEELKLVKKSDRDYLLTIRPVRTEDSGSYRCRVWKQEKTSGSFTRSQSQESSAKQVHVSVTESKLAVSTLTTKMSVHEGDILWVTCKVSGTNGQLSISWQHKQGQDTTDVISLGHNGVMEPGSRYRQRAETGDVRTLRATSDSFVLEIANAMVSDSGVYKCTVSEWVMEASGGVKKEGGSKSQEVTAEVRSVDSLIDAQLKSRTTQVKDNEEIELFCSVKGPKFPVTVIWKFKHSSAQSQEQVVSVHYDGVIIWWKEHQNYQLRSQVLSGETMYILKVFRASAEEAGKYQCVVEAYLRDTQKALKLSNELAVNVLKLDSLLSIRAGPQGQLQHTVGSDVLMECAILSVTVNTTRFAVSWIFQAEGGANRTLLSTDRDSVMVAGVGVGQRYSLSRPEARAYELILRQAEIDDSGRYYCLVEEWLQDPHGKWSSLALKSAMIQLIVQPQKISSEHQLRVMKTESEVKVQESEHVHLNCTLDPSSIMPTSHYSITWFFIPANSSDQMVLMKFSHEALLDYTGVNSELVKRLRFYTPARGSFSLAIQNMGVEDSGRYSCQVAEYLLNCEGQWQQKDTDQSGVTNVTVHQTESNLHVLKHQDSLTMGDAHDSFEINCNITSRSSDRSVFEVTWWRRQVDGGGEPRPIFRAGRNFTLQHLDKTRHGLIFGRPKPTLYCLTVPNAEPSDSGQYFCRVEEWLLSPRNTWRKIAEDSSGYLTVSFQTKASNFSVSKHDVNVTIQEHSKVVIDCMVAAQSIMPTSDYSVTWFFVPAHSSVTEVLMKYSHEGLLDYTSFNTKLVERIRFYTPARGTFSLAIQNVDVEDSGRYSCQVAEYHFDCEGQWQQMATDQSGVTHVMVHQTVDSKAQEQCVAAIVPTLLWVIIAVLVVVIGVLVYKFWKAGGKSAKKKQADSLWAENNPLKPTPEA